MQLHVRPILAVLLALACASAQAQTQRIRIMAANITSGNSQSYPTPGAGTRIFQGLDPDIVLIQEFNVGSPIDNSDSSTNSFVSTYFGAGFDWYREPGGEQIPNGIISRWPIVASGEFISVSGYNRDHAWARIDIPGDRDLWVVSTHLPTSSGEQPEHANSLVSGLQGLGIPANDYVAIGGDFNTTSRSASAVGIFRTYLGVTSGQEKTPVDQNGNGNTNAGRNDPYDWVLVDNTLNALHTPVLVGNSTYNNGLVFDSRVYTPLSEVAPVQSGDSGASNMQHMAVVKDFLVPAGTAAYTVSGNSIPFGSVDIANAPFDNSTITVTPTTSITLQSVAFTGANAAEFTLQSPTLPAAISSATPLAFRWNPTASPGVARSVTATFQTNSTPTSFQIALAGTPTQQGGGGGGEPVDVGGWKIEQIGSALSLTIPAGTIIPARGFLVVGRDSTKAAFEAAWSTTLGPDVVYINGKTIVTANGFPLINGDEQFRLVNATSQPVDPASGHLPTTAMATSNTYQRQSTATTAFTQSAMANATPGAYVGTRAGTNKVVITEASDATTFAAEFVELFNDAAEDAVLEASVWILR